MSNQPKKPKRYTNRQAAQDLHQQAADKVRDFVESDIVNIQPLEMVMCVSKILFHKGEFQAAGMMAKEALPYVHPKLISHDVNAKITSSTNVKTLTNEQLDALISRYIEGEVIEITKNPDDAGEDT